MRLAKLAASSKDGIIAVGIGTSGASGTSASGLEDAGGDAHFGHDDGGGGSCSSSRQASLRVSKGT